MGCSASASKGSSNDKYAVEATDAAETAAAATAAASSAKGETPAAQGDAMYTDLASFDVDRTEVVPESATPKDAAVEALERYAKSSNGSQHPGKAKPRKPRARGGMIVPKAATMQAGCMRSDSSGGGSIDDELDGLP
jgi:hypothetical protein